MMARSEMDEDDVRDLEREVQRLREERNTWQSSAREWESYAKRRDAELRDGLIVVECSEHGADVVAQRLREVVAHGMRSNNDLRAELEQQRRITERALKANVEQRVELERLRAMRLRAERVRDMAAVPGYGKARGQAAREILAEEA